MTTSTQAADAATDAMFGHSITPDKPAPTLTPDDLKEGAIVRHEGARVVEYTRDGAKKTAKLHLFSSKGGEGDWFSLFGTAQLDSQLRKARAGVVILLKYLGKVKTPDGNEPHTWEVRPSSAGAEQIRKVRELDWRDRETILDGQIKAAEAREKMRREVRQAPAPAPAEDDDLPF